MASIEYVVNATGNLSAFLEKAGLTADHLDSQLEDLSKRIATPEVDLKDTKFTLGMVNAAKRLDKLSAMVADPKVEVDSEKAQLEILRVNAMLDRLDHKRVTATVDVNVDRSFLSRLRGLFPGGGGGAGGILGGLGGAGGAAGGALGGLFGGGGDVTSALKFGGLGILGVLGAALAPAALPTLLGGGIGALGVGGGLMLGATERAKLLALQKQLRGVTGTTPSANARRASLQGQIGTLRSTQGPALAFGAQGAALGRTAESTFFGALTSRPVLAPGGAGPGTHQQVLGQSFLQGLIPVFKQIEGFIKSIGPGLGDMFRASLPFLKMFVGVMEQFGKAILPVITTALKQMQPYIPILVQGFTALIQGIADMIKAIGPRGMKASAEIFVGLMKTMGAALTVFGKVLNFLAVAVEATAKWIHKTWDELRHETAVIFDGIRHEIAHVWDIIYNNTIGAVIRIWHDVIKYEKNLRHDIANAFDTIRHDIATAWDTIWRNTVTRVKNGIQDVINWFKGLPGRAVSALTGLGTMLYNFGSQALHKLWNGMKNVFDSVWSWFKSLPSKLLHAIGIHSPPDWAIEAGKHIMGGLLHGITSRKDELMQKMANISAGMGGALSGRFGPMGGGVARWAGTVRKALAMEGLPLGLTNAVLYQMMTESGGNPYAQNNWDSNAAAGTPSKGLMQVIQPTFDAYHVATTSWNIFDPLANIAAAINYAAHNRGFGSGPGQIGSGHGYDTGGWLPPGVSIAVNKTGRPERVLGPGEGGTVININVAASAGTNRRALAQELGDLILYHTKTGGRLYPVGTAPR